jgi:hypothetical protein
MNRTPRTPETPTHAAQARRLILLFTLFVGTSNGLCACSVLDGLEDSEPLPEKQGKQIPAQAFVFAQITEPGEGPGGWWTGCLHLHLDRSAEDTDDFRLRRVTCDIEFGFPIVTEKHGRVSRRHAQEVAADVTNRAVPNVSLRDRLTAEICTDLWKQIDRTADIAIKGSRIKKRCGTTSDQVPEIEWP